ncbi:MAG TPA: hypothetical protein GXZ90_05400 [Clostridiales bacterium]|nr:hypothetical protein [Clostridiales bacterium]
MTSIYIQFVVAFDLIVLMFLIIFNVLPGKWYKWHTIQLQLILSTASFVSGLSGYVLSIYHRNYIQEVNSLFYDSFLSIFSLFYFMVFILSIYRYITVNKAQKNLQHKYIELSKSEYKIFNELNYTLENKISLENKHVLDDLVYLPNVSSYAVYGEKLILFPGARPLQEIDAGFVCVQIKDNVYECISYIDKSKGKSFNKIVNKFITFMTSCLLLLAPVLLTYTDYVYIKGGSVENIYNLHFFNVMFISGSLGSKLFYKVKGGKWLYWLCISSIILSNYYLVVYFK